MHLPSTVCANGVCALNTILLQLRTAVTSVTLNNLICQHQALRGSVPSQAESIVRDWAFWTNGNSDINTISR